MASSLTQIAQAFVTESRIRLKNLSTVSPVYRTLKFKQPRREDWYAVQKEDYASDMHSVGFWQNGKFWLFGKHVSLYIRMEVKDVVRWRPLSKEERKSWDIDETATARFSR